MRYLDTSVLVAYYCPEPLSRSAEEVVRAEPLPTVSHLTELELISALARKVREGGISREDAERVISLFADHLASGMYQQVLLEEKHFKIACNWIRRLEVPLRSLDALHLALAAEKKLTVVTADAALARAAERFGIPVTTVEP